MKIVPVFLCYDYGIKPRGDSGEYVGFYYRVERKRGDLEIEGV